MKQKTKDDVVVICLALCVIFIIFFSFYYIAIKGSNQMESCRTDFTEYNSGTVERVSDRELLLNGIVYPVSIKWNWPLLQPGDQVRVAHKDAKECDWWYIEHIIYKGAET